MSPKEVEELKQELDEWWGSLDFHLKSRIKELISEAQKTDD